MTKFNDFLAEELKDPEFKAEYDALEPEYKLIKQLIKARADNHMTQKQLAEKVGTRQSNIARLESGNYNPSFQFLQKVAKALNRTLSIELQ